jgi:putative FmdB family regulatory protein
MPTYDYKCENCGHTFEEDLKIVDRKIPTESPCVEQILHDGNPAGQGYEACGGEVKQILFAPYFGYDNIRTKHSTNKVPSWHTDQMKELKHSKGLPHNTL